MRGNETGSYECFCCGERHEGVPTDIAFDHPDVWSDTAAARNGNYLTSDYCKLDDDYFIRSILFIPLVEQFGVVEQAFAVGLWVTLSEDRLSRLRKYDANHEDASIAAMEESACYLANSIVGYPETWSLKALMKPQSSRLRPVVRIRSQNHPLYVEQQEGIKWKRWIEHVSLYRHTLKTPDAALRRE